jgi:hypothetical protein
MLSYRLSTPIWTGPFAFIASLWSSFKKEDSKGVGPFVFIYSVS